MVGVSFLEYFLLSPLLFQFVFHTAARVIFLKHKPHCVIPLLKTLQCLPRSLRIKVNILSITYYRIWFPITSMPNYSLTPSPTSFSLSLCFSRAASWHSPDYCLRTFALAISMPQMLLIRYAHGLCTHFLHIFIQKLSEIFCRYPI